MDASREEIREHRLLLSSNSAEERLLFKIKSFLLNPPEMRFSGVIFDIVAQSAGSGRQLDEFWLSVLQQVLLFYEDRRSDRSVERAKRLTAKFDTLLANRLVGHALFLFHLARSFRGGSLDGKRQSKPRSRGISPVS